MLGIGKIEEVIVVEAGAGDEVGIGAVDVLKTRDVETAAAAAVATVALVKRTR